MRYPLLFLFTAMFILTTLVSMKVSADLLFHDDFEKDSIDQEPNNWDIGFAGNTKTIEVKDAEYETGKFGNYGLVFIDNLFIGDSVDDLVLPVEPQNKISTTWGTIKSSY